MNRSSSTGNDSRNFSYQRTADRFDRADVAAKYPANYGTTLRERLERRAILKTIRHISPGSRVLDLPCGAGRLTPLLVDAGFDTVGADYSPHMVSLAHENWQKRRYDGDIRGIQFEVRDILQTRYDDDQFDAVICNRLFHHFIEPETRVKALNELRRICRGTLIVSFFDSFALDALKFRLKHLLRGTTPSDRIPIPLRIFSEEIRQAGLEIVSTVSVMRGFSPLCYVIARTREEAATTSTPGEKDFVSDRIKSRRAA